MPTCKCGKQVDDWRGARGHVQFTAGDGHGEKNEVPDGWKDLFDTDDESDDSGGSDDGRLQRALFEDVRALWGGDR